MLCCPVVGAIQNTKRKRDVRWWQWKMGVGLVLQIQIWNPNTKYRVLWCRHWAESGSVGWRRSQSAAASRAGRSVLIVPQLNNWSRGSIFEDSQLLKIQSVAWKNWVLTEGTAQTWQNTLWLIWVQPCFGISPKRNGLCYSDPRAEVTGQVFCAFCDNGHYVRVKETMVIEKLKHKP